MAVISSSCVSSSRVVDPATGSGAGASSTPALDVAAPAAHAESGAEPVLQAVRTCRTSGAPVLALVAVGSLICRPSVGATFRTSVDG